MEDKLYVVVDKMGSPLERFSNEESFINNVIKRGLSSYSGRDIRIYDISESMSVDGYVERIRRSKSIDSILSSNDSKIEKFIEHISKYDVKADFMNILCLLRFDLELKKIIKTYKISLFYYISNDVEWYDQLLSIYNFELLAFLKRIENIKRGNCPTYDPLTGKLKSDLDFDLIENNFRIAYEKRNNR